MRMVRAALKTVGLVLTLMIAAGRLASAAETIISGVVTDDAGKPLRGAMITAASGLKSTSRYSKNDGRFEITAPSGIYDLEVHAFGYGIKWQSVDTAKSSKIDFRLTPRFDATSLTPAEIQSLLPNNAETRFVNRECEGCHHLQTVMRLSGLTAASWKAFLPAMTEGRVPQPNFGTERLVALSEILEKYFGPASPYLGPDSAPPRPEQVAHVAMSDAALGATITEYKIPILGAMPNEVRVDERDHVWFGDMDSSNGIGDLDPVTGQFHMYPLETPNSYPISGLVGKDGTIWWSLLGSHLVDKLVNVNPQTGKVTYYKSEDPAWVGHGPHSMVFDAQGNIWSCGHEPSFFDMKSKTFRVVPLPHSKTFPEGSVGAYINLPGLPELSGETEEATSSIAIDSKGILYLTRYYQSTIVRLDPVTGQTKDYRAPGMVSPRGVEVDGEDNVWFGDAFGHQIGKLDPRTGAVKLYHPPSKNASPYAANIDKRTGYIYFSDYAGNKVTRFDPKTESFVEYPLPTPESYPRFLDFDSKGRIWYAAGGPFAGKIGVIDPGPAQSIRNR
jgi:streptogramin lyase